MVAVLSVAVDEEDEMEELFSGGGGEGVRVPVAKKSSVVDRCGENELRVSETDLESWFADFTDE